MTDPLADPEDVRSRLNLPDTDEAEAGISDSEIQTRLEDATFDITQVQKPSRMDDGLRKQLEWRLAGLKILSQRKGLRSYHQQSIGTVSRSYEEKTTEKLAEWIERHGPPGLIDEDGEFWHASIQG